MFINSEIGGGVQVDEVGDSDGLIRIIESNGNKNITTSSLHFARFSAFSRLSIDTTTVRCHQQVRTQCHQKAPRLPGSQGVCPTAPEPLTCTEREWTVISIPQVEYMSTTEGYFIASTETKTIIYAQPNGWH